MQLKLLQLNIFRGKFIRTIVDFVKKEEFDVLNFQEVTGYKLSRGEAHKHSKTAIACANRINRKAYGIDCFEKLKSSLDYRGEKVVNFRLKKDSKSYSAIATFYKNDLRLLKKEHVRMKPFVEYENVGSVDPAKEPRSALALTFESQGKKFVIINAHLAWGPDSKDKPYKLRQAKVLFEYVKNLNHPFVLSGDFNLDSTSQVVSWFSSIARNITSENGVPNTLNPRVHAVKELFPGGIAVDYIFVSKGIKVKSFRLVWQIDLSDHYGLVGEFEI